MRVPSRGSELRIAGTRLGGPADCVTVCHNTINYLINSVINLYHFAGALLSRLHTCSHHTRQRTLTLAFHCFHCMLPASIPPCISSIISRILSNIQFCNLHTRKLECFPLPSICVVSANVEYFVRYSFSYN